MGLSAFQHLTFLDAKIDDLESAAQVNSRKMLNLQQQLEKISSNYEDATSNRQMKIQLYYNGTTVVQDAKIAQVQNLTYRTLMSGTWANLSSMEEKDLSVGKNEVPEYASNSCYRLRSANGAYVVADSSEIPGYAKGKTGYKVADKRITVESTGKVYIVDPALTFGSTTTGGTVDAPNYLQDCLRNGKYLLEKGTPEAVAEEGKGGKYIWSSLSWDSTSNITDSYYTEDDDAAKAKYDRESNQISALEKKLELEQDNIETQRQKATKDRESAEKVIEDNVEKTFGIFA